MFLNLVFNSGKILFALAFGLFTHMSLYNRFNIRFFWVSILKKLFCFIDDVHGLKIKCKLPQKSIRFLSFSAKSLLCKNCDTFLKIRDLSRKFLILLLKDIKLMRLHFKRITKLKKQHNDGIFRKFIQFVFWDFS